MGNLKKIKALLQSMLVELTNLSTDKGILQFDEKEIAEGIQVWMLNEAGERVKAEDGLYKDAEENEYTVENEHISSIRLKENMSSQENAQEPVNEEFEEEQSQESQENQEDGAQEDGAQEQEQENHEEEAQENAEEKPIVVESIELTPEEAAEIGAKVKDEKDKRIEELENMVNDLTSKLESLTERFSAFENAPAAKPITEEFKSMASLKTGNEGLDRLARMMTGK